MVQQCQYLLYHLLKEESLILLFRLALDWFCPKLYGMVSRLFLFHNYFHALFVRSADCHKTFYCRTRLSLGRSDNALLIECCKHCHHRQQECFQEDWISYNRCNQVDCIFSLYYLMDLSSFQEQHEVIVLNRLLLLHFQQKQAL